MAAPRTRIWLLERNSNGPEVHCLELLVAEAVVEDSSKPGKNNICQTTTAVTANMHPFFLATLLFLLFVGSTAISHI